MTGAAPPFTHSDLLRTAPPPPTPWEKEKRKQKERGEGGAGEGRAKGGVEGGTSDVGILDISMCKYGIYA